MTSSYRGLRQASLGAPASSEGRRLTSRVPISVDLEGQPRAVERYSMAVQDIPTQQDERFFVMSNQHDLSRRQSADGQLDLVCRNGKDLAPEASERISSSGTSVSRPTRPPGITVRSAAVSTNAGRLSTDLPVSRHVNDTWTNGAGGSTWRLYVYRIMQIRIAKHSGRRDPHDWPRLVCYKGHKNGYVTESRVGTLGDLDLIDTRTNHLPLVDRHVLIAVGAKSSGKSFWKARCSLRNLSSGGEGKTGAGRVSIEFMIVSVLAASRPHGIIREQHRLRHCKHHRTTPNLDGIFGEILAAGRRRLGLSLFATGSRSAVYPDQELA